MRVKCQIKAVNRKAARSGITGAVGKAAQATLFVARKQGDVVFLVYCTAKNKEGVKFLIKNNIQQVFTRFLKEGKATIQVKMPEIDLHIDKAHPMELKSLLNAVKIAHQGESLAGLGVLSSLTPAKLKHVQKPVTKLLISSKDEFRLTSSFPFTLEKLIVSNCSLTHFDDRIFTLKALTHLDLTSNKIAIIPLQLSQMPHLSSLNLSYNDITQLPRQLFSSDSKLLTNLRFLDASHNELLCLPESICELKELWHLQISHNKIQYLPKDIGRLVNLRTLNASHNQIRVLSYSFPSLKNLNALDFFMNPFDTIPSVGCKLLSPAIKSIASLEQLTALVIRNNNVYYKDINTTPYPLIRYLDGASRCPWCCKYYYRCGFKLIILFDLRKACQTATSCDVSGGYKAPVEVFCCCLPSVY